MVVNNSLDVATDHGVCGILGPLRVAFQIIKEPLGGLEINETIACKQFLVQTQGCLVATLLSVLATYLIVKIMYHLIEGILISKDDYTKGLDQSAHGENGYYLN